MKTSAVFKLAKSLLAETYAETGEGVFKERFKEKFICTAIDRVARKTKRVKKTDSKRCEGIIAARLGGAYTLESWLVGRGCIKTGYSQHPRTLDRIQQHRHAWLDMLIAEFEAQGD